MYSPDRPLACGPSPEIEPLVRAHREALWRYAYRLCGGNSHDADDLLAESLLDACRFFRSYRGYGFEPWLRRILYTNRINMIGKATTRLRNAVCLDAVREDTGGGWEIPDSSGSPERHLLAPVYSETLQRALDSLPSMFRVAVLLHDVEEMEYTEIAERLRLPIGTVRTRVHRGRNRLRAMLESGNQRMSQSRESL